MPKVPKCQKYTKSAKGVKSPKSTKIAKSAKSAESTEKAQSADQPMGLITGWRAGLQIPYVLKQSTTEFLCDFTQFQNLSLWNFDALLGS